MSKSTYLKIPLPPNSGEEDKDKLRGILKSFLTSVIHDLEEKDVKNYTFMMRESLTSLEKVHLLQIFSEFRKRHESKKELKEHSEIFQIPSQLLERIEFLGGGNGSLPQ